MKKLFYLAIVCLLFSCGDDDAPVTVPDAGGSDFGKITSAIVIVNPIVNQGSTTNIESGTQREGVSIKAGSLDPVSTDASGLAVIKNLPIGIVPFQFSNGTIDLNVIQEKELYDMVVS